MVAYALPRDFATYKETSFAQGPTDPNDWNAVYVIEPDISSLGRDTVANENIRERPAAVKQIIHTLKLPEWSFSQYLHGAPTTAAEGVQATSFAVAEYLKNAIGGERLGFAGGFAGGTASAPEADDVANLQLGDWIFAVDADADPDPVGQFYRVIAIAGTTLTLDRDLHFTPDAGGADGWRAVITVYMYQRAITQHDHPEHDTHTCLVQGDDAEDVFEIYGNKFAATIEPITAGEPSMVAYEVMGTGFDHETLDKVALGTYSGESPGVPGRGDTSYTFFGEVGSPGAPVLCRGSITPNIAITYERDSGPCGLEGTNGYVGAGFGEGGPEIFVDFDDDYATEFDLMIERHLLVQTGDDDFAWGIYWPQLNYSEDPKRVDENSLTTSKLNFIARENQAAVPAELEAIVDPAEKEAAIELWRAPIMMMFVA